MSILRLVINGFLNVILFNKEKHHNQLNVCLIRGRSKEKMRREQLFIAVMA